MCGLTGYIDTRGDGRIDEQVVRRMTATLVHRGPDSDGFFFDQNAGFGFRRLSIIDVQGGNQPLYSENGNLVLICNGEIYNYKELREEMARAGHHFQTRSDVEVLLALYQEYGPDFLNKLNGQFAFAIYDRKKKSLFVARDHFGVNPLFYTLQDGVFIFGSEIKAILEHPLVRREVDPTGLDQVLSLPGLVSPRTMFKGIHSLKSGHYLTVQGTEMQLHEYWDLNYPRVGDACNNEHERDQIECLGHLLEQSVKSRLQADVPVGLYLSGGLDSSFIAALMQKVSPDTRRHSFSVSFQDREISEARYQAIMAKTIDSSHHEVFWDWANICSPLAAMIERCECPVKETYNTCSMALSAAAKESGVKVVLSGEGADEMFAGYIGYRFDEFGGRARKHDLDTVLEEELREKLWGDRNLFYETDFYAFREIRASLYSDAINECLEEFEFSNFQLVNSERLRGRHPLHQRSYLDFKLRLSDHLISDHGDRMALANSVEARYPFLDIHLIEYATRIPPYLKVRDLTEKYILRKAAEGIVPQEILAREKFGFHAPGSPYLLKQNLEWVNDLLSCERIKRQGYFNPDTINRLKARYMQDGFRLNLPFENDLLMVVLTFNIFLDIFNMPSMN